MLTGSEQDALFERLGARSPHGKRMISHPPGWDEIVDQLDKDIAEIMPGYQISQIKEKFGGLRFYIRYGDQPDINTQEYRKIHGLIDVAEDDSLSVCQDCGKEGRMRSDLTWMRTLCDDCFPKYPTRKTLEE